MTISPRKGLFRRFLCWVGFHSWIWFDEKLDEFHKHPLVEGERMPGYLECEHCGERYSHE